MRDEFNVRNIGPDDLPAALSLISMDLSFISVTKVLAPLRQALPVSALSIDVIVLVKPQFEVGKGEVGKGGIVREPDKRARALEGVEEFARRAGYSVIGSIPSPLAGAGGNQEFLLYLQPSGGLLSLS